MISQGEAQYLYCIVEADRAPKLGKVGIMEGQVAAVPYKEIAALVSPVPYGELESNLANIMAHQKVVELAREASTTLPVRFGVIFKTRDGVKELLTKSYASYTSKLAKLKGKDEYGVKVIITSEGMKQLTQLVGKESSEVNKLVRDTAKAKKGTAYLLKLKADEALRTETLKRLEEVSESVDAKLARVATDSQRLKSDHEQIVLNASYLVERGEAIKLKEAADMASSEIKKMGLELHMSGPWAPYSFC
jgi:Gas vesicle synthesis protein GvpL/GvpF